MKEEELKNMLFIIDTLLDDAITDSTRQKVKDTLTEVCKLAIKALEQQPCEDCRNCKKWNKCPCGKEGHENGTSIGYSIGECKDYEPCEDCISRQAVDDAIYDYSRSCDVNYEQIMEFIDKLPSVKPTYTDEEIDKAQAVEQAYVDKMVELAVKETKRPKGHWIIIDDCELFMAKCSECGEIVDSRMINKYPYCHCGAEMSGGGEDV